MALPSQPAAAPEPPAAEDRTVVLPETPAVAAAGSEAHDGTPDETTTAQPAPPPGPVGTVSPDEEPAPADVADGDAGPAERTVALPPVGPPREPVEAPRPDRLVLGRRALLSAGAGVVASAVVGGFAVRVTSRQPEGTGGGHPSAARATGSHNPRDTHVATLPVQPKPIFTLAEYRKATGAGPFPGDAISLTIDDGPHPVWTPKILRLLDQYQVPAMFCMIGNQVLGHEDIARMVTAAGHQLANHSWSHPSTLAKKTGDVVHSEISRAQAKIQKATGHTPKFFRSPSGSWSPTVLQQTADAGLLPLDWTNDPKDWTRPGVGRIEHTMLAVRPGQILLCHDGGGDRSQTYAALKVVLPQLKARGLRFVAL